MLRNLMLRSLERTLPLSVLTMVLYPFALVRTCWELLTDPTGRRAFITAAELVRGSRSTLWRTMRERLRIHLMNTTRHWPDRFCEPRWQARCRLIGREHLDESIERGDAIILAWLHFGPYRVLRPWLRAHGIPAAMLVQRSHMTRPPHELAQIEEADRRNGMTGVPNLFHRQELRALHDYLQPGRVLCFSVDGGQKQMITMQRTGFTFEMATGALRLAHRTGAMVIPCITYADGLFRSVIHFGPAVPQPLIRESNHPAALDHLLDSYTPVIRDYFEQFARPGAVRIMRAASRAQSRAAPSKEERRDETTIGE